jgi:hypothetical protein
MFHASDELALQVEVPHLMHHIQQSRAHLDVHTLKLNLLRNLETTKLHW